MSSALCWAAALSYVLFGFSGLFGVEISEVLITRTIRTSGPSTPAAEI